MAGRLTATKLAGLASVTLAGVLVFAACGDDGDNAAEVPLLTVEEASTGSGAAVVEGFLVAPQGEPVRLCAVLMESYPPQCGRPSVVVEGLDPAALPNTSTNAAAADADRVLWSDGPVRVLGNLTDGALTVTEVAPGSAIAGRALAGPVCPVERLPPDPACAPRPVADAVVRLLDSVGNELARTRTDSLGRFLFTVEAGTYVIKPGAVQGLLGRPAPVTVVVTDGRVEVEVVYDTGIR